MPEDFKVTPWEVTGDIDYDLLQERFGTTPIDDALIVLHITQNAYYKLNNTARFFFEQLVEGKSKDDIINTAANIYDADSQTLSTDFDASLRQFIQLGLLTSI